MDFNGRLFAGFGSTGGTGMLSLLGLAHGGILSRCD
jgi:hypothetical protein